MPVTPRDVAAAAMRSRATRAGRTEVEAYADGEVKEPYSPSLLGAESRALSRRSVLPLVKVHITSLTDDLKPTGYVSPGGELNGDPWTARKRARIGQLGRTARRFALIDGLSYIAFVPTETGGWTPRVYQHDSTLARWDDPLNDINPRELVVASEWDLGVPVRMVSYDDLGVRVWARTGETSWESMGQAPAAFAQFDGRMPVATYAAGEYRRGLRDWGISVHEQGENWWPMGEVWPVIGAQDRVVQAIYDSLLVSQFGATVIRTIAGMELPTDDTSAGSTSEAIEQRIEYIVRMAANRLLVSEDPETRFGALQATQLDPFSNAAETAIRHFAIAAAMSPTRTTRVENVSAEAIGAARQPEEDQRTAYRERWGEVEVWLTRLAAITAGQGDPGEDGEIIWKETEVRSLSAIADAVAKFATAGVPIRPLLDRSLNWSDHELDQVRDMMAADLEGREQRNQNVLESSRMRAREALELERERR